jgi:uncharacterized protein YndB with AHSA1/START domain
MNRDAYRPSPLGLVKAKMDGERWTLVFHRDLRHPPERVWAALTEPKQLDQWAPWITDRDLSTPGEATLTMIDGDTREDMAATVVRSEPPTLLEYTLGTDVLRWELIPTGTGTHLTLRHTVADADWLPKVAAGWHICLDVAEHLLDGDPVGVIRGSEAMRFGWTELHDAYAHTLRQ